MKKNKSNALGVLIALIIYLAWLFIAPFIVVHAWTLIAVGMFGAPALTYWPAFWGMWALSVIFRRTRDYKIGGSND